MSTPITFRSKILECTLRDGSYAINFEFTAGDTAAIAGALDRIGFPLIEVGHGIGLGASKAGMGRALETDAAYMKAAADSVTNGLWGMFCIPGIAKLDHLDEAADYGMGFVRVGTNVSEVSESEPFIQRAKTRGMFVCANFMKSYVSTPKEFAAVAERSHQMGTDVVYIVDSAGGMLPEEIVHYAEAVREIYDVALGFHGHNNLGMGVANALTAVDLGINIVDTSLQGFGRSAGNTATELLLAVLMSKGFDTGLDLIEVLDAGEKFVKPLISSVGLNSLDVVSGLSRFHSSYMKTIHLSADRYQVDPRLLIMAVCSENQIDAPKSLVEATAKKLAGTIKEPIISRFHFNRYHGSEQGPK